MMIDLPPPSADVQAVLIAQEQECTGGEDCDIPAGRDSGLQVTDGSVRRTGKTSLPEGGPSALESEELKDNSPVNTAKTTIYDKDGLAVRWYFQGGLNLVSESNLFWNFASVYAPDARFNSNQNWLEFYVKPGLGFDKTFANGGTLYGLSLIHI